MCLTIGIDGMLGKIKWLKVFYPFRGMDSHAVTGEDLHRIQDLTQQVCFEKANDIF